MRVKAGVIVVQWHPAMEFALEVIDNSFIEATTEDAVLTSAADGVHSKKSLHYKGRAADFRSRDLDETLRDRLVRTLRLRLGECFDVVIEPTHIHIEYDPYWLKGR